MDFLVGGTGADVLQGRDGDDTLEGNLSRDVIDGGSGNNVILHVNDEIVEPSVIIDDGEEEAGFNSAGFTRTDQYGGVRGDYSYSNSGTATWRIGDLTPRAEYDVSVTWNWIAEYAHLYAPNAPFRVNGSDAGEVNQQREPRPDFQESGTPFQSLGIFWASSSGELIVELGTQDTNGYVKADAVRIQRSVDAVFADEPGIGALD